MKNNTKVRLHLSKQLFESLAKQVLAEAKKGDMSGGAYTEAVKAPKGEKKADKEVKTETKPVSSAPKKPAGSDTTKGASKQGVATALKQKGVDLQKDPKANVQSAEGGLAIDLVRQIVDLADNPDNAAPILTKIKRVLDQNQPKDKLPAPPKEERPGGPFFEMETKVAEEDINEDALNEDMVSMFNDLMQSPFMQSKAAGVGIPLATLAGLVAAAVKDKGGLKKALDKATGGTSTSQSTTGKGGGLGQNP